jgi:hypothetical protein
VKKFKRRGNEIVSHLSTYEVELLTSLVNQLVDMVAEGEPEEFVEPEATEDPFELWSRELSADADQPEVAEDPVLRRLFPDAYPHDAAASSDFRRFTERDLRGKKISDGQQVLERLVGTEGGAYPVRIPVEEADVWLRTLTSLRLAVGIRLGITDAESAEELSRLPEEDPRAFLVSVYDWLGFAQETLVSALD